MFEGQQEQDDDCGRLNNLGVNYIVQGEYEHATTILSTLVRRFKHSLTSTSPSSLSTPQVPSAAAAAAAAEMAGGGVTNVTVSWYLPSSPPSSSSTCDADTSSSSRMEDDRFGYVFRFPIQIPEEDQDGDATMIPATTTLKVRTNTVIVVYNLALALHLQGTTVDDMHKAIKLYHLCQRMIFINHHNNNEGQPSSSSSTPQVIINYDPSLLMAITNNLGVLYRRVGDTTRSDLCFEHLLSTQMFVTACTCSSSPSTSTTSAATSNDQQHDSSSRRMATHRHLFEGFWNNTMQLVLGDGAASAA